MGSDLAYQIFEVEDEYFLQIQFYKLGGKKGLVMILRVTIKECAGSR